MQVEEMLFRYKTKESGTLDCANFDTPGLLLIVLLSSVAN